MTASRILGRKRLGTVTIRPDATLAQAVELLSEHNIGALVVTEDGVSVGGVLSERDIVHGLREAGAALLERRVADIMVREVELAAPAEPADNLLARMTERRCRHFPVVEGGRLIGIVSIGDVVKLRLDDLASEAKAMREYISG